MVKFTASADVDQQSASGGDSNTKTTEFSNPAGAQQKSASGDDRNRTASHQLLSSVHRTTRVLAGSKSKSIGLTSPHQGQTVQAGGSEDITAPRAMERKPLPRHVASHHPIRVRMPLRLKRRRKKRRDRAVEQPQQQPKQPKQLGERGKSARNDEAAPTISEDEKKHTEPSNLPRSILRPTSSSQPRASAVRHVRWVDIEEDTFSLERPLPESESSAATRPIFNFAALRSVVKEVQESQESGE